MRGYAIMQGLLWKIKVIEERRYHLNDRKEVNEKSSISIAIFRLLQDRIVSSYLKYCVNDQFLHI